MSAAQNAPFIVDNVAALEKKIAQLREAQQKFSTFSQQQVDKIFRAAALDLLKFPFLWALSRSCWSPV